MKTRFCQICGSEVHESDVLCPTCGRKLVKKEGTPEYKPYGKRKCEALREIRKQVAELNHLDIAFAECDHEGDCHGYCPQCDMEARQITRALEEKEKNGEKVLLPEGSGDYRLLIDPYDILPEATPGIMLPPEDDPRKPKRGREEVMGKIREPRPRRLFDWLFRR